MSASEMSDKLYIVDSQALYSIHAADRQTEYYWASLQTGRHGPYWIRWKKQHTDRVFETFDDAKDYLVDELVKRLRRAEALNGPDIFVLWDDRGAER